MELIKTETHLPTTIEDLQTYIAVGKERQKARRAEINAYDKIDFAETAKRAILNNAQNEADTLIDAESKLGELLDAIPPVIESSGRGTIEKKKSLPPTITKKESHYAQTVYKNKEIVNKVKAKARANDALPTAAEVIREVKKEKKAAILNNPPTEHIKLTPIIHKKSFQDFNIECDLLITDPPYMTDVENINDFVKWLPEKLSCVKSTGAAFICVGAYPEELNAYMNIAMPTQVLVWTYKNTLGQTPKRKYKLNWQAILYYRMPDAPELNYTITNEMWAVQEFNAPDGRLGDRYHTWQKPIELAKRLIKHNTKEGDIVFDCFSGTGTFLIAAAELGRQAVGCEIDNGMINIAEKRGCSYER